MTCKTRRNARGLGSIRQRPDGRWEGRLTIGKDPGTGKQVQRSVYGDTQKEVLQALQKLAVERDTGVYTAPTKITVKQWLEIWLDEYTGGVKSSTKISYRQHAQNHIIPALGAVKLSALKAAGLPEKRFHDLRHTYAVASLRAGDDIKTVQENLGHHTAAFTLDQYGHVTGDMRDESSRRMQRFIDGLK